MIEVRNLHKQFKSHDKAIVALNGVSLQAKNGSITGLLGHNGAGKSTTLRILYGLVKADSGEAFIDGIDTLAQPLLAQKITGVMTDAHGLYPRLSSREHIHYFAKLHGITGKTMQRRTDELLEILNMQDFADRQTEGFSQGQKIKVCLARSLVHNPNNLIMDEPTNGLDVMSTRSVRTLLEKLRQENKCILLSSHIMQEISALCDEVIIISSGRVIVQGSLGSILQQSGEADLEDAFVKLSAKD